MTLNKMMIIGNLGADPELRYTPSGKAVTNLRVAVNDRSRGADGEWTEETMWIGVEVWEQQAERLAEQLRKGNKVFVEGRFKSREFEGKDGEKRTSLDVISDNVISLQARGQNDDGGTFSGAPVAAGAASGGYSGGNAGGGGGSRPPADDTDLDDLPF